MAPSHALSMDGAHTTMDEQHYRMDVAIPHFDTMIQHHETAVTAQNMGGVDPDVFGVRRWGLFRYNVYRPEFNAIIEHFENGSG